MNRRNFLRLIGATGTAALTVSCNRTTAAVKTLSEPDRLARFPEKAEMILLTDRAPQLETPLHYFRQDLTPNEAFFVRWHLEGIPTTVDRCYLLSFWSGGNARALRSGAEAPKCSMLNQERRFDDHLTGLRFHPVAATLRQPTDEERSTQSDVPVFAHRG